LPLLEAIASLPGRPPLAGWVGDVFAKSDSMRADHFDLVAYTDRALLARHREWAFAPTALYLPHAVDPRSAAPSQPFLERSPRMVFIANPSPGRQVVVNGIDTPVVLFGPSWRRGGLAAHDIHGRVSGRRVPAILAAHQLALNVRNEDNVLAGLNQRNFSPCLAGAALLTDDQPDLRACFEAGSEVLVWRDIGELNTLYAKARRDPDFAADIAERGRARVLAHHTFTHRLNTLTTALSLTSS
jgi:spore maturation protein CgeB